MEHILEKTDISPKYNQTHAREDKYYSLILHEDAIKVIMMSVGHLLSSDPECKHGVGIIAFLLHPIRAIKLKINSLFYSRETRELTKKIKKWRNGFIGDHIKTHARLHINGSNEPCEICGLKPRSFNNSLHFLNLKLKFLLEFGGAYDGVEVHNMLFPKRKRPRKNKYANTQTLNRQRKLH